MLSVIKPTLSLLSFANSATLPFSKKATVPVLRDHRSLAANPLYIVSLQSHRLLRSACCGGDQRVIAPLMLPTPP